MPLRVVPPKRAKNGTTQSSLENSLSGDTSSQRPGIIWGLITLIVGALWWWTYRRWRHPLTWLAGVLPFLAVLFVFYVYLQRVLPANY